MNHLAQLMRELDRVIEGEADVLNPEAREFLATKLQRAILRCQNPPRRQPENVVFLNPAVTDRPLHQEAK